MKRIDWLAASALLAALPASAADLPDPHSPGAVLLMGYCTECHGAPSPAAHPANEWAQVVARMQNWRITKGMGEIPSKDVLPLVDYLKRHAQP